MAQSDIDKILEDIKKRKEQSQTNSTLQSTKENETSSTPLIKEHENTQEEKHISDEGKKLLSQFINEEKAEKPEFDKEFDENEYESKKSEDYIDENFMNFFTQSVIVTKTPEQTSEMKIKRKKSGFFKRKYVTDSLSLNIDALKEQEEKNSKKQKLVNTDTVEKSILKNENILNPKKVEKIEENKSLNTTSIEKTEIDTFSKPEIINLNKILGNDTDAESLARHILELKKKKDSASISKVESETQQTSGNISINEPEQNPIVNTIYTSVIEAQAKEAVVNEMTAFIPTIDSEGQDEYLNNSNNSSDQTIVKLFENEKDEPEVFEEYISNSEFFSKADDESLNIRDELLTFRQTLSLRIILGLVCGIILSYFNMASHGNWPMPPFISPVAQPMIFYMACSLVFGLVFVGFLPTIISGFSSIIKAPAPDSLISLGATLSIVQLLFMIIFSEKIDVTKTTIFAAYMCFALSFNAIGKKIATNTIIKNLTLANVPEGINAGYIVNDADAVKKLARTLDEKLPKILVSRKTGAISNFVKAGFSIHNSDYTARKLSIASWFVTALCFVLGWIFSKDILTAIFCAAGSAAIQSPLSQTLINSVPSALMQKNLEKVGALVNGWQGIDQLSKTTHVNLDAKHLFPKGTIILHGIKTFEKERIDLAILYAASVLIEKCNVLKPVFMDVIEGKTSMLYPVDSCEYIECQGYVSWINNNRVIIGNRTLMEKYDVEMPPISFETKFTKQERKPIYLAVGGKLFGMFILSYHPDEIVQENINKLIEKSVSIILSSTDFNIDAHLIEEVYSISPDYISVMNQKEASLLSQFTEYSAETEACMAHLDSLPSLVSGFCGAESARSAEKICSMMQIACVAIASVLSILFTRSQTIANLPLASIFLINFGFMGITMLAAVAKKY